MLLTTSSTEPLLESGRRVLLPTHFESVGGADWSGTAVGFLGFLEQHLGTDAQRSILLMSLAQGVGVWQTVYAASIDDTQSDEPLAFHIDSYAQILSALLLLAGNIMLFKAMHPKQLLLNAGYDGGRTKEPPASFWKRHFGTPLLKAVQLEVIAVIVIFLDGILQVMIIDCDVYRKTGGFWGLWVVLRTTEDLDGWGNIVGGVLGILALYIFNRTCYPAMLTQPRSALAEYLDEPSVERRIGRSWARWLQVHVLNDNLVTAWLVMIGTSLWMLSSLSSSFVDQLQPGGYFLGGLFFTRWAYNHGTMLDPVLFGCHKTSPLPAHHPMGELFNAVFAGSNLDVDAGIDAAVDVVRRTIWNPQGDGVWLMEDDGVAGMKVELEVELHAFALAQLFHSEEFLKQDPAVEHVEILATVGRDAKLLYVTNCASPPMPRSDQVFVSGLRESGDQIVVAQWAIEHPLHQPKDRVVRDFPFRVFVLTPLGPETTRLTVCVVTTVASFMPHVLVSEELEKGISQLQEIQEIPQQQECRELVDAVQREVWLAASTEVPPCMWDLFQSCAPGFAQLNVVASRSESVRPQVALPRNLLHDMCELGVRDPMKAADMALAFSSGEFWREPRRFCSSSRRDNARVEVHKVVPHALRASGRVAEAHPMVLALCVQLPEFKRQADPSITELREIRKVNDFCSVYYQRTHLKAPFHDRDAVYACLLVDKSFDRALVVEWPVQVEECPEIAGVHRSRSMFLYDIQKQKNGSSSLELTITAVIDMRGSLGSRFFRPIMKGQEVQGMVESLGEIEHFFCTEEGREAKMQIENGVVQQIRQAVRNELTALQLGFMEAYSQVFREELARHAENTS